LTDFERVAADVQRFCDDSTSIDDLCDAHSSISRKLFTKFVSTRRHHHYFYYYKRYYFNAVESVHMPYAFSALTLLVGRQEGHSA